jgi:hypothetical protein
MAKTKANGADCSEGKVVLMHSNKSDRTDL